MLYTVKIMRGKTTLKQFAVIADGDTTLQKFAADALGEQADDTAEMMKFGVCDSAELQDAVEKVEGFIKQLAADQVLVIVGGGGLCLM